MRLVLKNKKTLIAILALLLTGSLVIAQTHTSTNYTLSNPKFIVSGGKAASYSYSLNNVTIGKVFSGKAKSLNYSLDATALDKRTPPNPPTLNPVTTPTNLSPQTLSGTKDKDTSIYINGYEAVPLNSNATWSYEQALTEGSNHLIITSRNKYGLESESVDAAITLDTIPPLIPTLNPVTTPTNISLLILSGTKEEDSSIWINGEERVALNSSTSWSINISLTEGENTFNISAKDTLGNESEAVNTTITLDTISPQIIITSPKDGAIVDTNEIILEGTVDGTGFSETIILSNEGENTITKTVQDEAGNISSASVTIYYYPRTLIGLGGGEVMSFDGKVKVIIPAGALSEPTYIRLLSLDKESLQSVSPQGHNLLSIVECEPHGLIFNKDVQLIYTLDGIEVPGTPIALGFYDFTADEINLTGIDSVIGIDGYTVNFAITHFSTYGALKSLVSGSGAPIGSGVEIPLPDMFTGAFSHSIPLILPPGRKSMQPNLQLLYRSSNPNSWTGVGFSLNPGYIVRSTRLGPPTYIDEEDTFYFITNNGTTELVYLTDNLYQAKIESSFTKFFKETDDSWRVVNKDGSVLTFGQTDASKETSTEGTFSWYITKVIDTNTNYIEYSYTKNDGKCYLSSIEYTGNENVGFSPKHQIKFSLEPRDDVFSSYLSGAKIATTQRLSQVQVSVNAELVWRYALEYIYSEDTNRSLLKSITQYAADGKAFPTQTFTYQSAQE